MMIRWLCVCLCISMVACQKRNINHSAYYLQDAVLYTKASNYPQKDPVQIIREGDVSRIILYNDYLFQPGSATLFSGQSRHLKKVVAIINSYGHTPVQIYGFTDNAYGAQESKRLSLQQAETIATFLWNSGVDIKRINTRGMGKGYYLANNNGPNMGSANRRVEIILNPIKAQRKGEAS